jgi:hypothetical protein
MSCQRMFITSHIFFRYGLPTQVGKWLLTFYSNGVSIFGVHTQDKGSIFLQNTGINMQQAMW